MGRGDIVLVSGNNLSPMSAFSSFDGCVFLFDHNIFIGCGIVFPVQTPTFYTSLGLSPFRKKLRVEATPISRILLQENILIEMSSTLLLF